MLVFGQSPPYDVAEDCRAGLEAGVGLDFPGELTDVGDILAKRNDSGALPRLYRAVHGGKNVIKRELMLRDDDRLAAAGDRGVESEVAAVPSHNLDYGYALVGCGSVAETVDALDNGAERSAESD